MPPDAVTPPSILAAQRWTSNADMIVDAANLGYLEGRVLDPTYGRGLWWTKFKPDDFTHHDLRNDGIDFRRLPYKDGEFDTVAFDPPYIAPGGRSSTGIGEYYDRYGLTKAPRTPKDLRVLIGDGIREAARVVDKGGYVLVKCMDYISSGQYIPGVAWVFEDAVNCGLKPVDQFIYLGKARPQPSGRSQKHARRNLSNLWVFQKPTR